MTTLKNKKLQQRRVLLTPLVLPTVPCTHTAANPSVSYASPSTTDVHRIGSTAPLTFPDSCERRESLSPVALSPSHPPAFSSCSRNALPEVRDITLSGDSAAATSDVWPAAHRHRQQQRLEQRRLVARARLERPRLSASEAQRVARTALHAQAQSMFRATESAAAAVAVAEECRSGHEAAWMAEAAAERQATAPFVHAPPVSFTGQGRHDTERTRIETVPARAGGGCLLGVPARSPPPAICAILMSAFAAGPLDMEHSGHPPLSGSFGCVDLAHRSGVRAGVESRGRWAISFWSHNRPEGDEERDEAVHRGKRDEAEGDGGDGDFGHTPSSSCPLQSAASCATLPSPTQVDSSRGTFPSFSA